MVGRAQCHGGGMSGKRSVLMGSAILTFLSCPQKMRNDNSEGCLKGDYAGMRGRLDSNESFLI